MKDSNFIYKNKQLAQMDGLTKLFKAFCDISFESD